jgi:hypothetical protein
MNLPKGVMSKFCPGPKEVTRYRLENGWFIDGSTTVVHRHYSDHKYSLWAPGLGEGGGAKFIQGGNNLAELVKHALNQGPL